VATIPVDDRLQIIEQFGPHLSSMAGMRLSTSVEPDAIVKTHCCFCGQQCGIQLKVRDNEVIGFEPWGEFPFNRGMLCPKGVKRYLQGSHPDRLVTAFRRDESSPSGFSPMPYGEAIARVAAEIGRLQQTYGASSIGVLGGASLTTEKTYLLGKFARVCLKTPYIDYNGRLCMVSAGAANKKAFGIDRTTNPWSDIIGSEVIWVAGSNVAECSPITTNYLWQAREMGARVIIQDPRITPIARTCDLYLPVRPGRDAALFAGVLQVLIERGWIDRDFIDRHTVGFDEVAAYCAEWPLARTAEVTGVPERALMQAAEWWGTAKSSFLLHARGIEHHSNGVQNALGTINLVLASGRIGKPKSGYGTITGQANGQGGREHGQKCDQLPGQRSLTDPAARQHVAGVWGISPDELPGPGYTAVEIMNAIHAGEIKGLLSICFNPMVSLPEANFTREALEKLEFFGVIDFFLSETAAHADVVLAGSLQEEEEGVTANVEARVIHIQKAVDPPGDARPDSEIICDLARRLGRGQFFPFQEPREIFEELRLASQGGLADYYGITYEKIDRQKGVFWPCPTLDHPGTPRLFEDGRFFHSDGKAHFMSLAWRDSGDPVDADFPVYLTTGRVVSQYLSGTQTRRIGALVDQYPEPKLELHPRLASQYGITTGDWVKITSRRSDMVLQAMVVRTIRPDTVFIPYHWPDRRSVNLLTHRTLDPRSKIPEFKVSACRIEKSTTPGDRP
jgi:assimilatory nitrate reductase catalytic subunit